MTSDRNICYEHALSIQRDCFWRACLMNDNFPPLFPPSFPCLLWGHGRQQWLFVFFWGPPRGGYMFPCSLEKIGVFPLFPKNKLRCSLKFTFIKFPCSQKFCCMFPWSPEILINVPQNFNHISVFDGQYFRKFYLVSHSRDNPQQNASFVSLMNAASPLVHQQKFLSPL